MKFKVRENCTEEINGLQNRVIKKLDVFFGSEINDITIECFPLRGVRGKYEGQLNLMIVIKFKFIDFLFEFYLHYNQLEYYIYKNSKILKKCNLEDFTEDEKEMVIIFVKYLKKDLGKLKIPYNE